MQRLIALSHIPLLDTVQKYGKNCCLYLFTYNPDKYENTWEKRHVKEAVFQVLMHRTDLVYAAASFGGKPCSFLPTPSRKTCSPSERQEISH